MKGEDDIMKGKPRLDGLMVSVSASQAIAHGFSSCAGYTRDHHKMVQTTSLLGTQL